MQSAILNERVVAKVMGMIEELNPNQSLSFRKYDEYLVVSLTHHFNETYLKCDHMVSLKNPPIWIENDLDAVCRKFEEAVIEHTLTSMTQATP